MKEILDYLIEWLSWLKKWKYFIIVSIFLISLFWIIYSFYIFNVLGKEDFSLWLLNSSLYLFSIWFILFLLFISEKWKWINDENNNILNWFSKIEKVLKFLNNNNKVKYDNLFTEIWWTEWSLDLLLWYLKKNNKSKDNLGPLKWLLNKYNEFFDENPIYDEKGKKNEKSYFIEINNWIYTLSEYGEKFYKVINK